MKFVPLVITVIAAAALVGCAQKPRQQAVPDCTFLENPSEKAPSWACAPYAVDGFKDTGFGSHPRSGAGAQFSMDQAAAKARAQLATQVGTRVTQMIKDYVATTGAGATETVDRAAESVTKQITAQTLNGAKVARQAVDQKGNVYVLVGMDLEASKRQVEGALQTSMRSQPALWQQFRATQGHAELAAEIYKMGDKR